MREVNSKKWKIKIKEKGIEYEETDREMNIQMIKIKDDGKSCVRLRYLSHKDFNMTCYDKVYIIPTLEYIYLACCNQKRVRYTVSPTPDVNKTAQ